MKRGKCHLKNLVWRGGYKKIFVGGGLIFNRRVGNISKRGGGGVDKKEMDKK